MEVLRVLEEKINSLVGLVKELKSKNDALDHELERMKAENQELRTEKAKLIEENNQLADGLKAVEVKGNDRIEETKVVVDDLIKSIDELVQGEH